MEVVFTDDDGQRRVFDLTAKILPADARHHSERLESDILLIWFDGFDLEPVDAVLAALGTLTDRPARGVILDLRGNSGGALYQASRVMGALIADPAVITVMTGRFMDRRVAVDPAATPYTGPLVVLVDAGSLSAAEVLAAALQESRRAVIIGKSTPGMVVASRHLNLPDGGRLSVGMQELRTP